METLQTICIALIQGITEFLPISSSAHIQLPSLLLGWKDPGLHFDVAIHAGSLLAVLAYFRRQLASMASGALKSVRTGLINEQSDLVAKLGVATLPVVVAGFLLQDIVAVAARDLPLVVVTTVVFGAILGFADLYTRRLKARGHVFTDANPSYLGALIVGLAQIIALVPGASRSGVTITAALFLGMSRTQAATFSFLLAIPTIIGAFSLTIYDLVQQPGSFDLARFTVGFSIAAISAYLCIGFFLRVVETIGLWPFVVYRLLIGIFLGMILWL